MIECREKKTVDSLCSEFRRLLETKRTFERDGRTYDTNSNWLGYVVTDILHGDVEKVSCRGTFQIVEEVSKTPRGYGFKLFTDTAWCACSDLFESLAEQYDLDIYWLEIEPGFDIFYSNDESGYAFPQRYWLDSDVEGEEMFETFEDLAKRIEEITGTLPSSLEDIDIIEETYDGDYLTVHEIEYSQE